MAFKDPKRFTAKKKAEVARKKMMARLLEFEIQDLSDRIDHQTVAFVDSSKLDLATKEQMTQIISLLEKWNDAQTKREDILRTLP